MAAGSPASEGDSLGGDDGNAIGGEKRRENKET